MKFPKGSKNETKESRSQNPYLHPRRPYLKDKEERNVSNVPKSKKKIKKNKK